MDYLISRENTEKLRNQLQNPLPVGYKSYSNGKSIYVDPTELANLKIIPSGVVNIPEITADKINQDLNNADASEREVMAAALLEAPDEKYSCKLSDTEREVLDAIDQSKNLELVKQFYEAYYSPTGFNDSTNRLGEVSMTVRDMHNLLPKGAPGIIGADANASWRTNVNYMFNIDTKLEGANKYVYTSYAFAPMVPRLPSATYQEKLYMENTNQNQTSTYILHREDAEGNTIESEFNMDNLTYTGNEGTVRKPGFKSINDNINLLQFLMTGAFGVESTYINEWDLSMYMQEGIVDSQYQEDINHPGTYVYAPVFCTTLTFGLLNDTPISENQEGNFEKELTDEQLKRSITYGSWNMAVSNRKGIDSITTSRGCNLYNYDIPSYPLSKYWTPPTSGENLNYYTRTDKKTAKDSYGKDYEYYETWYSDMNVSHYWDDLFSFRQTGEVYGEDKSTGYSAERESGLDKYTPAHILGSNLYAAKWPFEFALKHNDDRLAILSGWNSTDDQGNKINTNDTSNYCKHSNSMAYLPFWKQFFYNSGEGMEDLDQYWQSLNGDGQEFHSILTCADEILDIIAADNEAFNSFKKQKQEAFETNHPSSSIAPKNSAFKMDIDSSDSDEVGNISFSVPIVGKITIPHTKLLNMFLKRDSKASEAMNKGNSQKTSNFLNTGTIGNTLSNAKDNQTAIKTTDPTYAYNEETGEVELQDEGSVEANDVEEAIGQKLSYADGVNNFSPFLYGGPHGRYFSPNTLEGYCQVNNEMLKLVPTMETTSIYHGKDFVDSTSNAGWRDTKNFKKGSFLSTRICMSLIERSNLLGLRRKLAVPKMTVKFSSGYTSHSVARPERVWRFEICIGWWHRICWSWSIPKQISALNADNWGWSWPGSWDEWETVSSWNPRSTTAQVSMDNIMRDFSCDLDDKGRQLDADDETGGFYITPVPSGWNPNLSQGNNASRVRDLYEDIKTYAVSNGINYAALYGRRNVKFLITPVNAVTTDTWGGIRYNCGDLTSGNWHNCMHNYYVNSNYGKGKIPISIPIRKPNSNEILCTVVGNARVIKTKTPRVSYHWVLKSHIAGPFRWAHYERHKRWWWTHCWRWCWHYTWYRWNCWHREKYLDGEFYAYNLLLDPIDITQIVPSKNLIESSYGTYDEVNKSARDKTSTDIIDRWKVTSTTDMEELYPFSPAFLNKYGVNRVKWGKTDWWDTGNEKSLRSNNLIFGDIMENYVNNGNKVVLRLAIDYRFIYHDQRYSWTSHYKDFKWGWYIVTQQTHHSKEDATLHMKSDYMIAKSVGYSSSPILTNAINEIPSCPSILYNESGAVASKDSRGAVVVNNNNIQTYLYNNYDLFDSFIDTCTLQISFLNQLKDYAARYLSDDMIYSTYKLVTDPVIQNVITKSVDAVTNNDGVYYTNSYTEDINYFTALEILERKFRNDNAKVDYSAFGTLSSYSKSTNSICTLVQQRIRDIQAIRTKAQKLRAMGLTWDSLEQLSLLVSDTYGLLNGCNGIRDYMFPNGSSLVYTSTTTGDSFMVPSDPNSITYNLVDNPTTLVWAYLNVLYQARKFYVNKRLDKVSGSYWILRALERILTFQAARTSATSSTSLISDDEDLDPTANKNKSISFVESRTSTMEASKRSATDLTVDYTKAVYVKVKYIADSNFMKSSKFNKENQTYNNQNFTYVEPVYKYAYKPDNGYYYIMSKSIKEEISNLYKDFTSLQNELKAGSYPFKLDEIELVNYKLTKDEIDNSVLNATNVAEYLKEGVDAESIDDLTVNDLDPILMAPLYKKYKTSTRIYKTLKEVITYEEDASNKGYVDLTTLVDELKFLSSRLLKYYRDVYMVAMNKLLYRVYIDWNATERGVGSSTDEGNLKDPNDNTYYFIDENQYAATNNVWRKVTDSDGIVHQTQEPLSSGITFGVAEGANIGTLLTNFDKISNLTATELACSAVARADYWRIEVPEEYNIPITSLNDTPVLVADYALNIFEAKISGTAVTHSSVLTGVSRNLVSPIKHHDTSLITTATATALGEGTSLNSLGLTGITPSDVESSFG